MTLILRDSDIRACLTPELGVDVVGRGAASAWAQQERSDARSIARVAGGWLRTTSGALADEDVLGFKTFQLVPGHGVRYLTSLWRLSTGEALALLDANHLTVVRTSAAAAAAARRHWGPEPIRLGVIGSGLQARDGLRSLAAACSVTAVRVYSPRPQRRESFAADLSTELGLRIDAAASPREAAEGADMVMCATQTDGTVALRAEDLDDQPFVSSVSSTLPAQRELDERVIGSAAHVVIDTPDALKESGDLLAAVDGLDATRVCTLGAYLSEPLLARSGRTVYKSIGSVEQDLSIAAAVWRRACALGLGEEIAAIELLKPV